MKNNVISDILSGNFLDPITKDPVLVSTESVVIEKTLSGMETELISKLDLGKRFLIVTDENTYAALGSRIESNLKSAFKINKVNLTGRPNANMKNVELIKKACKKHDSIIAVGSGTISDLVKYAAYLTNKPYVVFGTAPSMNGYTSINASIVDNGLKKTFPAAGAKGVFMDLEVLANCPKRLIRAGLGDCICRSTAQKDWLLANFLFSCPYQEIPYILIYDDEEALFSEPDAILKKNLAAIEKLIRIQILSGFGMTICKSTQPASQGEHLIGHYIEMMGSKKWPEYYHGEVIGVTTLTMARIQESIINCNPPKFHFIRKKKKEIIDHFGPILGISCWKEFSNKILDDDKIEEVNSRITKEWNKIVTKMQKISRPVHQLEAVLHKIGAPLCPSDLFIPDDFYRQAIIHAREIRNRYTFLDLAGDCGLLESLADISY